MSTKIYNAYKFKGGIEDLIPNFREIGKQLLEDGSLKLPKETGDFSAEKYKMRREMAKERELEVVVYFHDKNIYIQLFGGYGTVDRVVEILGDKIEDFHYQDQTDSDVCEEEYEKRKKVWDEIFNESWSPAKSGLSYKIISSYDLL